MSLIISHKDYGFFSCCSVKLDKIVDYINKYKKLPESVNGSELFTIYKPYDIDDITYDFFDTPNISEYIYTNKINYHHSYETHIMEEYHQLDFKNIIPILKIYFEPSHYIKTIANYFIKKYNIDCENCVALYYRGKDKCFEMNVDSFESFHNKLDEILKIINNESIQILIQTDTSQFLDYIIEKNKSNNLIIINELTSSYTNIGLHYERTNQANYTDITNLLSIVQIMSKCKYIICSSGNVSSWIMMYRGNSENVYQNLKCKWV
jgi:hypothetical protein